jgi:nucleotide-binding universal stress UspA family protein
VNESLNVERRVEPARILVGTDFSEGATRALDAARRFAEPLNAELDVVHVVERFSLGDWRSDEASSGWLTRAGVDVSHVIVRTGFPWVELVRQADDTGPTMIVVGSHGSSGFQPLTLGSTAARLGILSPYPVLVVTTSTNGRSRSRPMVAGRAAPGQP